MNAHLSTAKHCAWYMKGKLRDIGTTNDAEEPGRLREQEDINDGGYKPDYDPNLDLDLDEFNYNHNSFHFIPTEPSTSVAIGEAGPGPSSAIHQVLRSALPQQHCRVLDEVEDNRVVDVHLTAGRIYRKDDGPAIVISGLDNIGFDNDGDVRMSSEAGSEEGSIPSSDEEEGRRHPFYPFKSVMDWQIAQWAMKDGPGQNAINRLLSIPGVVENLGLSFHNVRTLHQKIDSMPEKAGVWKTKQLTFDDRPEDIFTIRYRDPIEAIKSLWRDTDLSPTMKFAPERIYSDATRNNRIYSEMWTTQWWHVIQANLPPGATVAPVIIASDKTQLTQFSGSKQAYPVYLTIGNIPKILRRKPSKGACILIAYLSVDKMNRTKMRDPEHRS
ncbi:hypothetical protein B0H34DRAFT_513386 [Crassisporium funariophilum]|nr:hypothetical protein B0H34DRAFT_513386 [Crassisporium funariophilum]